MTPWVIIPFILFVVLIAIAAYSAGCKSGYADAECDFQVKEYFGKDPAEPIDKE